MDEPIETPNHAAGRGRKAWRAVRTAALLGTLGLAGMLMVEPPAAFNLTWSDAAAAQISRPAAERWESRSGRKTYGRSCSGYQRRPPRNPIPRARKPPR